MSDRSFMVACPTCDGTGSGNGFGIAGAGGSCPDCRMSGEVTRTKRARLMAVASPDSGPTASTASGSREDET